MGTLKNLIRISRIILVISLYMIPLYIKLTRHNLPIMKRV
jgi:hypothetical protein